MRLKGYAGWAYLTKASEFPLVFLWRPTLGIDPFRLSKVNRSDTDEPEQGTEYVTWADLGLLRGSG
jgi:hypothetical protein